MKKAVRKYKNEWVKVVVVKNKTGYHCKVSLMTFKGWIRVYDEDYYTDCKNDAIGTAQHIVYDCVLN